jgi:hypothetical protein
LVCRYSRTSARLYVIRADPQQTRNLIEDDPETAVKTFEEYALKDAGDRCRLPDLPRIVR